ncbi:hypothetical protein CHU_0403 [Cytophaga hutchinsonii ATCC 33406]|uniref:Lipoprotein n=2 Tax=Cytophaga hutchinsonii TaxID=985 RepID=A0A6N4SN36_CYTH3|nr:hypothetical protein CHU_0403 [Cytophaga hutchinsonii ATCC 33406]
MRKPNKKYSRMKQLHFFYLLLLCSSCTLFESEKEPAAGQEEQVYTDTLNSLSNQSDRLLADTNKVLKLRTYAAGWDNTCLPIPTGKVLLRNIQGDAGYMYLTANFDSVTSKTSLEKERSAGAPCIWKQKFRSGIIYSINSCKASGANYKIETPCTDKKTLIALVDVIFQQTLNMWDADSSNYKPILEGPGNYYSIQKNTKGTYDLLYTTDL